LLENVTSFQNEWKILKEEVVKLNVEINLLKENKNINSKKDFEIDYLNALNILEKNFYNNNFDFEETTQIFAQRVPFSTINLSELFYKTLSSRYKLNENKGELLSKIISMSVANYLTVEDYKKEKETDFPWQNK
jgi:hypothetical protein